MAYIHMPMAAVPREFSSELKGTDARRVPISTIAIPEAREREINQKTVDAIATSMDKQGQLQPICCRPIPVKDRMAGDPVRQLVFGAHRLLAMRKNYAAALLTENKDEIGRWDSVLCIDMSDTFTDEWAMMYELAENLVRGELTSNEKKAHIVKYAGCLKLVDDRAVDHKRLATAAEKRAAATAKANKARKGSKSQSLQNATTGEPDVSDKETVAQAVSADLGVSSPDVTRAAKMTSAVAGETVDLENDTGAELVRKADAAQKKHDKAKAKQKAANKKPRGVTQPSPHREKTKSFNIDFNPVDPDKFVAWLHSKMQSGDIKEAEVKLLYTTLQAFVTQGYTLPKAKAEAA